MIELIMEELGQSLLELVGGAACVVIVVGLLAFVTGF